MKLFFAGAESQKFAQVLIRNGVSAILESAYYLDYKNLPNRFGFADYLLDSGGYTALMKNIPLDLKRYIDFINQYQPKYALALDVPDPMVSLANTYELKKSTQATIIPVYHDFDYFNKSTTYFLEKYCADFDFIAIGGLTRTNFSKENLIEFGNFIFSKTRNKIRVHGLAVTTLNLCLRFPFYSVDSTTWLSCMRFGHILDFKNGGIVSSLGPRGLAKRENREDKKDFTTTMNNDQKLDSNVKTFLKMNDHVTDIWKSRGVVWKN